MAGCLAGWSGNTQSLEQDPQEHTVDAPAVLKLDLAFVNIEGPYWRSVSLTL